MNRNRLSVLIAASLLGTACLATAVAAPKKGAAPDIAALAGPLANQQLVWRDSSTCGFDADTAEIDGILASRGILTECADVTVPRDWHDSRDGNTLTVKISRVKGKSANAELMTVNPGGPGASGTIYPGYYRVVAKEIDANFYVVGFDPRGTGASTPLNCRYVPGEDAWTDGANLAKGCLDNPLAPYINSEQTAYDMDFIRHLMGKRKLSYIGYSYGTWLGTWYQRVFADNVHRFVLDSNTDLTRKSLQETWDLQPKSRDRQFQQALLPYIARHNDTYGLGADPVVIRQRWEAAGGTRSGLGRLVLNSIIGAMYSTSNYPSAAGLVQLVIDNFADAQDHADPQLLADEVALLGAQIQAHPGLDATDKKIAAGWVKKMQAEVAKLAAAQADEAVTVGGAFNAIRCQDGQWNSSQGYWSSWAANLQKKFPFIGPSVQPPACANWPAATSMPKAQAHSYPATLLVQSELDAATPYEAGLRSAQTIKNHYLVSVDNEGSHGLYPYGDECVDGAVENWLVRGELPAAKFTTCAAKPLPREQEVYPVAGEVKGNGKIKLKMIDSTQKQINRLLKSQLAESAAE